MWVEVDDYEIIRLQMLSDFSVSLVQKWYKNN